MLTIKGARAGQAGAALGIASLVLACACSSAAAGTVSRDAGGKITIAATDGQRQNNSILVQEDVGPKYMIADNHNLTAQSPCVNRGSQFVECPEAGTTSLSIFGNDGSDQITSSLTISTYINGGAGADFPYASSGGGYLNSNCIIDGGIGKDLINSCPGGGLIFGGPDNDEIDGRAGGDLIFAGAGNDKVNGHGGADFIWGGENNTAPSGKDEIVGGSGPDKLFGEDGDDKIGSQDVWFFDDVDCGIGTRDRSRHDGLDTVNNCELPWK